VVAVHIVVTRGDFASSRLRGTEGATAIDDVSYTDPDPGKWRENDMSEMSLPCSMKKMRQEVRLISKQDLTITSGTENAQDRSEKERQDETEDKEVPPKMQQTTRRLRSTPMQTQD
jgi:hypothetical protein